MRIISGLYRGKKLFTPASETIRPTGDKARESIFNILNSRLAGDWESCKLLDVFAGTGAIALEAISRGIGEVCIVDKDIALSTKNANLFPKEKDKIKFIKCDALKLPASATKYDIVFLDAPYGNDLSFKCLEVLKEKQWLKKDALCIIELSRRDEFSLPECFEEVDVRNYGISRFVLAKFIA